MRTAIVGCGGIAQVHAASLKQIEEAQLVACADIRFERARAMAEEYGCAAYDSLDAMLDAESIDVVHLCTPHVLHVPMAQCAAARGIHVFTEKPPAITHAQWRALRDLENTVRIGVCFQNRYNPPVRYARALLQSGEMGEVRGARAFVTWKRETPYYTQSGWRGKWASEGGGVLINQSIHTLDLMVYLLGEARLVGVQMANHHLWGVIEVEDTVSAQLDFSGAPGLFYATTAYSTDAPIQLEIDCENGTLCIGPEEMTIRINGAIETPTLEKSEALGKGYWGVGHPACIRDFYRCVHSGAAFQNDPAGVDATVRLMLDMYEPYRRQCHAEI